MGDASEEPSRDDVVDFEEMLDRWADEAAADEAFRALTGDDAGDWVSLGEAEKAASVSRSTLRAWYRSGRIPSRLMPGPHGLQRLVPLSDVLERAARSPRAGTAQRQPAGPTPDEAIAGAASDAVRLAEVAIAQATERAERAEARAEAAEALLHAALERAAAAEAELRLLGRQRGDEGGQ